MNFDWKKILGAVLGLALAAGLGYAAKNGVTIPCPANPAVIIDAK